MLGLVAAIAATGHDGPRLRATAAVALGLGPRTITPPSSLALTLRRSEGVAGTFTGPLEGTGKASVVAATEAVAGAVGLATSSLLQVGSVGTFAPTTSVVQAT